VIELRQALFGKNHRDVANSLNTLAVLLYMKGNYEGAEHVYQQILAIRRRVHWPAHPELAIALINLAVLYRSMGRYTEADARYQEAQAILRSTVSEWHPYVAISLYRSAVLRAATGQYQGALTLLEQAAALDARMIGQVFAMGSESHRLAYVSTFKGALTAVLSLTVTHLAASPSARQAAFTLVVRRKGMTAEALILQRDVVLSGKYPELAAPLQALHGLRMQIARKALEGPGTTGLKVHRQLLKQWEADKERREEELARHIPEMHLMPHLRSADCHTLAHALPAGAALVEFVRFREFDFAAVPALGEPQWKATRYVAFVLPAGAPDNVCMINLGEADPIDQLIARWRAAITGEQEEGRVETQAPQTRAATSTWDAGVRSAILDTCRHLGEMTHRTYRKDGLEEGIALRRALFDPLLPALEGRHRLILAPDGNLTRLPFEALPVGEHRYLIDTYTISYVSVGRDILHFGDTPLAQTSDALVVADPDFDLGATSTTKSGVPFPSLRGARDEGEQVGACLRVIPWLQAVALESRLKMCHSPRILHLATHGFFLPDMTLAPEEDMLGMGPMHPGEESRLAWVARVSNPLLHSGLALAGANTWAQGSEPPPEAEDGILTAEDVTGLDLRATEVVVLSACETGLGKVHAGEGVFGLRRAFVLAGAKTLVMSLWKVPDVQTQALMRDFYGRLLAGWPRVEALRAAQLMIKQRKSHPFFWGAFICQGESGPLPEHTAGANV
jgi:CHAT domain-containing protein